MVPIVKNRGGKRGVGQGEALGDVLEAPDAPRRDDGHVDGLGDGAQELEIVAGAGTVAVHAGEQDLAGAERDGTGGPGDGVEARGTLTAVGINLPRAPQLASRVDGDDDGLGAPDGGGLGEQSGPRYG